MRTRRYAPPARITTVTIDFGPDETHLATADITDTATTEDRAITVIPTGIANDDHDPEDPLLEELHAIVTNRREGDGYTITAYAPNGTWGRHTFHAIG